MIYYTDQNNNRFIISKTEIVYKAIQHIESSSGTYSGGIDKQVKISLSDFELLKQLAFEMIEDEKHHANKREMMTSIISILSKGDTKQVMIYPSPQRETFEKALHKKARPD